MGIEKKKAIIEAILFAAGRVVRKEEIMATLEVSEEELDFLIAELIEDYKNDSRGIELLIIEDGYQLATKKDMYDYLYLIFDKRAKPNLSQAALETLSIIAYNPKITRAEIEAIRGVNSDGTIYKLLEYELIEVAGKLDAPGRPTTYKTTSNFLKMFGLSNLDELPELPKYKVNENEQIVIEDLVEEKEKSDNKELDNTKEEKSNNKELDDSKEENNEKDDKIEEKEIINSKKDNKND